MIFFLRHINVINALFSSVNLFLGIQMWQLGNQKGAAFSLAAASFCALVFIALEIRGVRK